MSADFFNSTCQEPPTTETSFGVCDDQNNSKAYLDFTTPANWIAEIDNASEVEVIFTAIDNCIDLLRANGTKDNQCDGMLTYTGNIIFVELKESKGKSRKWLRHGEKQLISAISHFSNNHDITVYPVKRAFLSNNKKPFAHSSQGVRIRRFKRITGVDLYIMTKIVI